MKFAFFVRPHLGGTYSVFTTLRAGLAREGIDLQWIGLDPPVAGDGISGRDDADQGFFAFNGEDASEAGRAAELARVLDLEGFDGVFINVLAERLQMNIARYLPERLLRIMIVHNITPATYAAARAIRDSVHATVGVSARCRRDLVERHGFAPERTVAIPNAVDVDAIANVPRPRSAAGRLRLLYLGRIEDAAKGVFWLPRVLDALPASIRLTVAGDGPDLPALRERLRRHGERVTFLGGVAAAEVPQVVAGHDVMVVPSRYEGFGITVIEAMAGGCVPVVARISGVTDTIVDHGRTGFLFPVGDWSGAARRIAQLAGDRALLADCSRQARQDAIARFGVAAMGVAYRRVIDGAMASRPAIAPPLSLEDWSMPMGFQPGLRTFLPRPVKNWLRVVRERL